jgi:hypothetical protein
VEQISGAFVNPRADFDLSQEMIIVGNICGEESYGDANIVEAQATGYGELSGSRESNNLAHSGEQEAVSEPNLQTDPFRPNMADQIRERLRGSSDTGRWAIWSQLAATRFHFSCKFLLILIFLVVQILTAS